MKRDPRLHGLSSEHHHALVLARTLLAPGQAWGSVEGAALAERFAAELEPHFQLEEEILLPALRAAGATSLAIRTDEDHGFLRAKMSLAAGGDYEAAAAFGQRLQEHVRFEERELFPACEALLTREVLDEVARRCPKGS